MKKICFLVGSVAISGGTYVIFQHACYLQSRGFKVTLAVQEPFTSATYSWHPDAALLSIVAFEDAKSATYDLVIGTWWKTALALAEFRADRYAYFVQSVESRFYPEHEVPLRRLVESTYQLPVHYVTEVAWIERYLSEQHGQRADVIRNGVRKDLYYPKERASSSSNGLRILVEGPFRVRFKNVGKTIQLVRRAGIRDITLLTSSPVNWVPGVAKVYSRVPITAVPDIYRSCDVLVKLSTVEGMFGPPLEMFHSGGTAVVYDVSGYDEYIVHGTNALVAPMGNEDAVVQYLRQLMEDHDLLVRLKKNAQSTAEQWPSWEASSAAFLCWAESVIHGPFSNRDQVASFVAQAWHDYAEQEEARLRELPKSVLRNKVYGLVRRLPAKAVTLIEQSIAIYESVR